MSTSSLSADDTRKSPTTILNEALRWTRHDTLCFAQLEAEPEAVCICGLDDFIRRNTLSVNEMRRSELAIRDYREALERLVKSLLDYDHIHVRGDPLNLDDALEQARALLTASAEEHKQEDRG